MFAKYDKDDRGRLMEGDILMVLGEQVIVPDFFEASTAISEGEFISTRNWKCRLQRLYLLIRNPGQRPIFFSDRMRDHEEGRRQAYL